MLQTLGESIPDEFTKVIRQYLQLTCFLRHSYGVGQPSRATSTANYANGCFIA